MIVVRLANGNLLIPRRAEGPGGIVGDGVEELTPQDPRYRDWLPWITDDRAASPPAPPASNI